TLAPGGPELDLSSERRAEPLAHRAYQSGPDKDTGVRTRAVRPLADLQAQVPDALQTRVSIYELVDGVRISDVADPKLRTSLARLIIRTELEALFERGVFDPDAHPGNWLLDLKNK